MFPDVILCLCVDIRGRVPDREGDFVRDLALLDFKIVFDNDGESPGG